LTAGLCTRCRAPLGRILTVAAVDDLRLAEGSQIPAIVKA
jgi:molybdopterin-binding protein